LWQMSGIAGGVAFVPAVPGLAPRGFYGGEGGVARVIEPALQASAGRIAIPFGSACAAYKPPARAGGLRRGTPVGQPGSSGVV